jgi:hypothetical protein
MMAEVWLSEFTASHSKLISLYYKAYAGLITKIRVTPSGMAPCGVSWFHLVLMDFAENFILR